jgi:DNA-binding CsgD family transcriptional regulator
MAKQAAGGKRAVLDEEASSSNASRPRPSQADPTTVTASPASGSDRYAKTRPTHVGGSTTTETVDVLRNYSNRQGAEKPVLALISDAARDKTPRENRNKKSLQPRVRRLSDSEVEELVRAYKGGDSVYALGRRFGIHRTTVSEHLKRAGVQDERREEAHADERGDHGRPPTTGTADVDRADRHRTTEYAVRRELGQS